MTKNEIEMKQNNIQLDFDRFKSERETKTK